MLSLAFISAPESINNFAVESFSRKHGFRKRRFEEDTAVDDQEFAFELEDVHVAPHLAEAAQRDDAQRPLLQGRGFAEVLIQGIHTFKSAMPGGAFIARGLVHRGRNPHIRV